jgi:hypothetical protein
MGWGWGVRCLAAKHRRRLGSVVSLVSRAGRKVQWPVKKVQWWVAEATGRAAASKCRWRWDGYKPLI